MCVCVCSLALGIHRRHALPAELAQLGGDEAEKSYFLGSMDLQGAYMQKTAVVDDTVAPHA